MMRDNISMNKKTIIMLVISVVTFVVCISIIGFIYLKNTENNEQDVDFFRKYNI